MHTTAIKIQGFRRDVTRLRDLSRMPRLIETEWNNAIGRLQTGKLCSVVARDFRVSPSTITGLGSRYQCEGWTRDFSRSGRPPVITRVYDGYIRLRHLRDCAITPSCIRYSTFRVCAGYLHRLSKTVYGDQIYVLYVIGVRHTAYMPQLQRVLV